MQYLIESLVDSMVRKQPKETNANIYNTLNVINQRAMRILEGFVDTSSLYVSLINR